MSLRNDVLRRTVMGLVPGAAAWYTHRLERRIGGYAAEQQRLREAYGIRPATPIRGYDEITKAAVMRFASSRRDVREIKTSGSTAAPKVLAYPPERLTSFKDESRSVGFRSWRIFRIRAAGIFVLSSLADDDSFTSMVVHQKKEPDLLTGLIEPARYLFMPALQRRIADYGATAVRLWLMVLSNPGLIYSTNPSTLAVFLSEVHEEWTRSTAMIRDWLRQKSRAYDADTRRIAGRVEADDPGRRLRLAAHASEPPPIFELLPGLSAYCSWDGGYVGSFLRQIRRWLPPDRYDHIPMYSMSTETIETITWFGRDGTMRFLPLGPGVLYEFLPEDAEDEPQHLLLPHQLEEGRVYAMVVSDPYGLVRYQTEDLFLCRGQERGLPDLRFLRRRGLTWSFTGEKLTGEQTSLAYDRLEAELPELRNISAQLTTLPSWPEGDPLPRYRLVVAHPGKSAEDAPGADALRSTYDRALCDLNEEYAAKRNSGRLAPPDVSILPYDRLAAALDAQRAVDTSGGRRAWESQFKLTPLTRRRWEELSVG